MPAHDVDGDATQPADQRGAAGQRAGDGFRALAELDSNGDGVINASDAAFGELKLWVDANSDGEIDLKEFISMMLQSIK